MCRLTSMTSRILTGRATSDRPVVNLINDGTFLFSNKFSRLRRPNICPSIKAVKLSNFRSFSGKTKWLIKNWNNVLYIRSGNFINLGKHINFCFFFWFLVWNCLYIELWLVMKKFIIINWLCKRKNI